MRVLLLAVVALLFAPLAEAATPDPLAVSVSVGTPKEPVKPLAGFALMNVTVRFSCAHVLNAPPGTALPVKLEAKEVPSSAVVSVTPTTIYARSDTCKGTDWEGHSLVVATLTQEATALSTVRFNVTATLAGPAGTFVGKGGANVTAAYAGILEAAAPRTIGTTTPGNPVRFEVTLTNHANGPSKATFEETKGAAGWKFDVPAPLTLDEHGGPLASRVVAFVVTPPDATGVVNDVQQFDVTIRTTHADDASLEGDEAKLSFIVTSKAVGVPGGNALPSPALPLVALALVAAALVARRAR